MRKTIKKYGNSAVIVLTQEDMNGYDWEIGNIIDLSDAVKVKHKNE